MRRYILRSIKLEVNWKFSVFCIMVGVIEILLTIDSDDTFLEFISIER